MHEQSMAFAIGFNEVGMLMNNTFRARSRCSGVHVISFALILLNDTHVLYCRFRAQLAQAIGMLFGYNHQMIDNTLSIPKRIGCSVANNPKMLAFSYKLRVVRCHDTKSTVIARVIKATQFVISSSFFPRVGRNHISYSIPESASASLRKMIQYTV